MLLELITTMGTYKIIFISILINKQNNDNFKLKNTFYFNWELYRFQFCRQADNNALYVPDYPCDIFSLNSAIDNGARISFGPNSANMITHDGRTFDITKKGKLYYLPTKNSDKLCVAKECTPKRLHDTMGDCNGSDLLKLETVVGLHGIQIKDPDKEKSLQHLL